VTCARRLPNLTRGASKTTGSTMRSIAPSTRPKGMRCGSSRISPPDMDEPPGSPFDAHPGHR
jgi:hypothetical protein